MHIWYNTHYELLNVSVYYLCVVRRNGCFDASFGSVPLCLTCLMLWFCGAVWASAKCGEWQMALKLFDSLFTAGLSPDVRTYSSAILACFKGQQVSLTLTLPLTRTRVLYGHSFEVTGTILRFRFCFSLALLFFACAYVSLYCLR